MRKIKIIEHISLDGVIQAGGDTDGGFTYGDWSAPYRSPAGLAMVLDEWGVKFDLLIGRRTYDLWSNFWPQAPSSPMADRLNAATKYVVTHRSESLKWGPFEGVGPDIVNGVRGIKGKGGADIIISGSSTLTSVMLEHGLVDEMLLLVNPVLLGKGKRIFPKELLLVLLNMLARGPHRPEYLSIATSSLGLYRSIPSQNDRALGVD